MKQGASSAFLKVYGLADTGALFLCITNFIQYHLSRRRGKYTLC